MEKSGKFLKKLEKMELRDGNYELFKGLRLNILCWSYFNIKNRRQYLKIQNKDNFNGYN
jgi:hypothetical protein